MNNTTNVTRAERPPTSSAALELLQRIAEAVERMERHQDQFFGEYLNRKFPYGKPTDRWKRSA